MLRLMHLVVIGALVAAAVVLYEVKYESTFHAQRIAKLRAEIRAERDRIAWLRAEWNRLAAPERIQQLATRHLGMKPHTVSSREELATLPEKPKSSTDPIGDIIDDIDSFDRLSTGSTGARE